MALGIEIDKEKIARFCRKWKITEFSLFGSVLRKDFGPESDVDVLVTFAEDADWSLLDHMKMEDELEEILARKVDILSRRGIQRSRNPFRKHEILATARPIYEVS